MVMGILKLCLVVLAMVFSTVMLPFAKWGPEHAA